MAIRLITGPTHFQDASLIANEAIVALWERAQAAGTDLLWCPCQDFFQLEQRLREAQSNDTELVLLDLDVERVPADAMTTVCAAIAGIQAPCIEIHSETSDGALDRIVPSHPPLVNVTVPGQPRAAYGMALAIGLNYLHRPLAQAA